MDDLGSQEGTIKKFKDEMAKAASDFSFGGLLQNLTDLTGAATEFTKTMGNSRGRVIDFEKSMSEAIPMVNRLGGELSDVSKIMEEISLASHRNVIASAEDVEQLYAAYKVTGKGAGDLSEAFLNVGVGLERIPDQLKGSLNYIQSIGGNTKQVFNEVYGQMDKLNRFQFEGGVQGLTKMAAQASMLRFDMGVTFKLAEDVLKPEGAIEMASAFQRLGVSVGGLADPFALMNQAINDPSGLQDSLVNVAKQFTYFDEKTKTFKINPQGVLTLKEMESQTHISATEMTKLGLAAAEADKRLSQINPSITFKDEEDKQYLQNIAKMGDAGTYEVTLQDGTKKELAELTQPEFDKLIKEQKEGPKTVEDIARNQMKISERMEGDLTAIKNKVLYGITSQPGVLRQAEGIYRATNIAGGAASSKETATTAGVRKEMVTIGDHMLELTKKSQDGTITKDEFLKGLKNIGNDVIHMGKSSLESAAKAAKIANENMKNDPYADTLAGRAVTWGSGTMQSGLSNLGINPDTNMPNTVGMNGIPNNTAASDALRNNQTANQSTQTNKTEVDGEVTIHHDIKIEGAQGLSVDQLNKALTDTFNTTKFQDYIKGLVRNANPTKEPAAAGYNP